MAFLLKDSIKEWINLLVVIALFGSVSGAIGLAFSKPERSAWLSSLYGFLALVAVSLIGGGILVSIDWIYKTYAGLINTISGRAAVGVTVFAIGCFAYVFKRKRKLRYGQLEVLFGALSAIGIASKLKSEESVFAEWVGLVGSAYVVTRGLTNWSEALDSKDSPYPWRSIRTHIASWPLVKALNEKAGIESESRSVGTD
jgi:hypothetical protein